MANESPINARREMFRDKNDAQRRSVRRKGLADNSAHKFAADDGLETNEKVGDGVLDNESR